jgi:26S proteasome regulatory subunit T5
MDDVEPEEEDILDEEILSLSTQDLQTRKRLLENDARIMKSEFQRLSHEKATMAEKIKENMEKIANNRYSFFLTVALALARANVPTDSYLTLSAM